MEKDIKAPKKEFEASPWFLSMREKAPTPGGTFIFVTLRILDLPLQYWLLKSGAGLSLIQRLGGRPATYHVASTSTFLGLSPYYGLIFGLAVGSAAKQIFWRLAISEQVLPAGFATIVAAYNTIFNSINTLLSLWAVTSNELGGLPTWSSLFSSSPLGSTVPFGLVLYAIGMYFETWSEVQRKRFKMDPANKDKPFTGGLFGLATNINYGGYTLWRTGYSIICAGLPWGAAVTAWLAGDFCGRAIPNMEAYCQTRYGKQWTEVRRKVPYRLLPWVY
ncbi:hypothetical protein LTR66_010861 [Elasticomyces elasticus]|nr:hypothetical protein LTR66_010861 [Elasticomyces elasticus]